MQTLCDDHFTSTVEIPIPAAPFDLDEADSLMVEEIPEADFRRC
jgi:hypothetical protein